MFFRSLIIVMVCLAALLAGCAKKSEAEIAEEERAKLRAEKRVEAAKVYKELADKFPEHAKAAEASAKAQALSAAAPKK